MQFGFSSGERVATWSYSRADQRRSNNSGEVRDHAASAAYAVVLLTPDDEGRIAGESEYRGRVRQNVIFELGFFFGKLGHRRVAVLLHPDVERPSGLEGLVYIPMDRGGAWKHALAKELEAADISVNYGRIP